MSHRRPMPVENVNRADGPGGRVVGGFGQPVLRHQRTDRLQIGTSNDDKAARPQDTPEFRQCQRHFMWVQMLDIVLENTASTLASATAGMAVMLPMMSGRTDSSISSLSSSQSGVLKPAVVRSLRFGPQPTWRNVFISGMSLFLKRIPE